MGNQPGAPAGGNAAAAQGPLPPTPDRAYTIEEIAQCKGQAPDVPILIAVKGRVYDVTAGAAFYGPGQQYSVFAGRDSTRALAKSSLEKEDLESTETGDLSPRARNALEGWLRKYESKYKCVGYLKTATTDPTATPKPADPTCDD